MNVAISNKNNVVIITVEGSIDSKTAGEFQSTIMDGVSGTNKVILDLSKVNFVSSAGLRLLLMIYRQITSRKGKVVLVGVSEEISDIMEMTGFIKFFAFSDTMDEALKSF